MSQGCVDSRCSPTRNPADEGRAAARGQQFLSAAILELSDESLTERELYCRIAEQTREFLGGGIVTMCSFLRDRRAFRIEAIAGAGEMLAQLLRQLGRDPLGMTFGVDAGSPWSDLASPVLNRLEGGLFELVFGRLPEDQCLRAEQALDVGQVWVMGLGQGGRLFGSMSILLPARTTLESPRVIETQVLLATSALQRRRAQDERRVALRDLRRSTLASQDGEGDLTARIMDSSPIGILVLDRSGRVEFANRRARTALGSLVSDLQSGEGFGYGVTDHEGRPIAAEDMPTRQVLATGRAVSGARVAFHWPDGRCLYGVISASPLLGRSGDVERIIETFEDVTTEVVAGRHLRASHERFQRIVDEQVEMICRCLPDDTLTYVNPAFCAYFDLSPEQLLGTCAIHLVHPEDRETRRRHQLGLTPLRPVGAVEHRVVNAAGQVRWLQWTDRASFDAAGQALEYLAVGRDITERREADERMAWLATHDPVTGLPNRVLLGDRLAAAMARSARNEKLFAVVLLDLDRFKDVNDTRGHAAGDALLKAVGSRLKSVIRRSDTLARLGGDEFTLVIADLKDIDAVEVFAHKVLDAFHKPFDIEGGAITASASVGVAVGLGLTVDGDTLLRRADRAMYQAKRAGRNAVRLFEDDAGASLDGVD